MSKSLIQTANQTSQTLTANSVINPGTVLRRYGCNCRLSGNGIEIEGEGYYKVNASFTFTPTAVGNVTVTLFMDGVAVQGAKATGGVSTVGNSVTLPIVATVRKGCCCDGASSLTFVVTGNDTVANNASIRVEKS